MDQQVLKLMRDRHALAAEVRLLRSLVGKDRRASATVRRAAADALYMVQARFLGHGTGRVEMARQGMSKRRWQWAVAYLRYAGVVAKDVVNWRYGLQWQVEESDALYLLSIARHVSYSHLRTFRRSA